jgi:polyferredoxin
MWGFERGCGPFCINPPGAIGVSPSALADVLLVVHFAFVAFVVGGFALILAGVARGWAWVRNPVFRWTHLAAIGFVAVEALAGIACPLTVWEDLLRRRTPGEASFIGRWVSRILYWDLPPWIFTAAYALFAAAVAYVMRRHPPRALRRANRL